jgi:DNA-binding beta-propeller fold protein YncE
MVCMIRLGLAAIGILLALAAPAAAQTPCNAPSADVTASLALPGAPFAAMPTADGCTIFVSLTARGVAHIAVVQRAGGNLSLAHDVAIAAGLAGGMALSHDGKTLALANGSGVVLFDTARLMAGDGTALASAGDGNNPGSIYAAITPDDRLLFVSDENIAGLSVYDLAKLRGGNSGAIGRVATGFAPVGLAISPDGRTLYSTSEIATPAMGGAESCAGEGGNRHSTRQGILTVVDVAKAATSPDGSVLARIPAGCDPVRVALSGDRARAYVTARGEDAVLAFDTANPAGPPARIAVGKAPVGIAVAGERVIAADSNRFAPPGRNREWLSVIDDGAKVMVGAVPAGLFPRELKATADGKTLLVTNFASNSLELVDLTRLDAAYYAQQKQALLADLAEQAKIQAAIEARIKSNMPTPGTEDALRHQIETLEKGQVDYDTMTPGMAAAARQQAAGIATMFAKWGALRSIAFQSVNGQSGDVYEVTFEHAKTEWTIAPLTADGKIAGMRFVLK